MTVTLELKNVCQAYDQHLVVKDLSFSLKKGTIGCLLGQSGCGKTTVLRTIAGFESIVDGEIIINGKTESTKSWILPPEKRNIGMVFQDYALFPHLTVYDNVTFGLKGFEKGKKIKAATHALETVRLSDIKDRYPHELSGGQQQRVALARALAPMPELMLMDEPFSNLDIELRDQLSMEVREILKEYGATALIVTHSQNEAFAIADEIGVMNNGIIEQWDTAHNIYHKPASTFVANFVGEGVLLNGIAINEKTVRTGLGELVGEFCYSCKVGEPINMLVRPEDVVHDDDSPVKAEVIKKAFRGANILYTLLLESGDKVLSLVPSHHQHPIGTKIGIRPEVDDIVLFNK